MRRGRGRRLQGRERLADLRAAKRPQDRADGTGCRRAGHQRTFVKRRNDEDGAVRRRSAKRSNMPADVVPCEAAVHDDRTEALSSSATTSFSGVAHGDYVVTERVRDAREDRA